MRGGWFDASKIHYELYLLGFVTSLHTATRKAANIFSGSVQEVANKREPDHARAFHTDILWRATEHLQATSRRCNPRTGRLMRPLLRSNSSVSSPISIEVLS